MQSVGLILFCHWSTKIYFADSAGTGLSTIMWYTARVMIMQNAVLFGFKHITGTSHWSIMLASADLSWAKWASQEELSWAGHSLVPQPTCCSFSKSDVDSVLASQEDLSWTLGRPGQGRPGRPGQPVVIVNLLGLGLKCQDLWWTTEIFRNVNWCQQ